MAQVSKGMCVVTRILQRIPLCKDNSATLPPQSSPPCFPADFWPLCHQPSDLHTAKDCSPSFRFQAHSETPIPSLSSPPNIGCVKFINDEIYTLSYTINITYVVDIDHDTLTNPLPVLKSFWTPRPRDR